jgi:hypothetical protein
MRNGRIFVGRSRFESWFLLLEKVLWPINYGFGIILIASSI